VTGRFSEGGTNHRRLDSEQTRGSNRANAGFLEVLGKCLIRSAWFAAAATMKPFSWNLERLDQQACPGFRVQFELPEESLQPVTGPAVLKEGDLAQMRKIFPDVIW
jgi:hypothetical protein